MPRQLPCAARHFVGREAELRILSGLLDEAGGGAGTVVISAIGGTAGVGKTALALHWAHLAAGRFGDGQLYVNLRGFGPSGGPATPEAAIRGFLDALGVPPERIPSAPDAQAGLYRSLLADRAMLLVLDNARDEAQVRPLLPASPASLVLVTSRSQLSGLAASDGARRLSLDVLAHDEAVQLLTAQLGSSRADAEPVAVGEVATLCAHLPLALTVAAARAAARPGFPLTALAAELRDAAGRLDALDVGDPVVSLPVVFSWSYRQLSGESARMFRLAGLHPGLDFDLYAAAALTGTGLGQARAVLDALAGAHLIQPTGPGRADMHDLLRAYARELAARDSEEEQDTALTRLFDYYLHTASAAVDTLHPAESHRRPRIPPPATPAPPVTEPAAARAWLDAERATLMAVATYAAGHSWPTHATRLSDTLFRYLDTGGHYSEGLPIHSHARAAAKRSGDRAAEASALNHLAVVHWRQSRYQQAAGHLHQALALFRQTGDRTGQARALANLALIHHPGRFREAIGLHRQALAIYREIGDRAGEALTLANLGLSEERLGRYDTAARHYRQALAITTELGVSTTKCLALVNLGTVGVWQGRYQQAADHLHRALALSREVGYREAEADALARIGDLCLRQDRPEEAVRHLREALALHQEIGSRSGEADALTSLGEVLVATGQPDHARAEYAAALHLAARNGEKYHEARAHRGLGQACHATGDPGEARRHWQQALTLFTELDTPEAEQVRAQLATAQNGSHQKQETSR